VYYAAPEFHSAPELNAAFAASSVAARSAFFAPSDIGPLPDEAEHFVAFRADAPQAWTFSEAREVRRHTEGTVFGPSLERRLRAAPGRAVSEFLRDLGDTLLNVYEQTVTRTRRRPLNVSSFRSLRSMQDPGRYAQFVSQTLFGCQALVLTG